MRHLAAEQAVDFGSPRLHLQRLDIVRRANEIELGRKRVAGAVFRIEPIAREDGQLAVAGEFRQTLFERTEIAVHRRAGHLGKSDGVGNVGIEGV